MSPAGGKGISSGLQPGGVKPSTEKVTGVLGRIDTPGAQTPAGSTQPRGNEGGAESKQDDKKKGGS